MKVIDEVWKLIKDYEGLYEISNLGRVKSLMFKNRRGEYKREKILKAGFNGKYYHVRLSNNMKVKIFYVHRLVAEAFIDNPNNYKCVNHINGIKIDNRVENLEWCTYSYNTTHAYKNGLEKVYKGKENYNYNKPSKKRKKVGQYDENNNLIKIWDYAGQIEKTLNLNANNIRECCRNNRHKVGNYIWKYM